MTPPAPRKTYAVKDGRIEQLDEGEVDYRLTSPNQFFGSHIGLIPLQSAVQGPRLFYGARFFNQAMPVRSPEAPWVQNKPDDDERSFDEIMGEHAGAVRARAAGKVKAVTADHIELLGEDGAAKKVPLYNNFPFNRKSAFQNTPKVKAGDTVLPGQLLARSNYTDDHGTLALGLNARVALVPYKGHSMDDAVVVSEEFAKRLTSEH